MFAVINSYDMFSICGGILLVALITGQQLLNRRLQRVERKLDVVMNEIGIDWEELPRRELSRQVRSLAEAGERQLAVELHQRESGLTVDEAQVAVEAYMRGDLPDATQSVPLAVRRSA